MFPENVRIRRGHVSLSRVETRPLCVFPAFPVLANQYLLGVLTRQKAATVMVKPNSADLELMRNWIEADKLRIHIDKVYPLAQIGDAFAYSETGKATGKVILKVGLEGGMA